MTDSTDSIVCRYTGQVETDEEGYVIRVPDTEVELGPVSTDNAYQVTIEHPTTRAQQAGTADQDHQDSGGDRAPVTEGERIDVRIEDLGQQGDGIARVGPGYVLIVPGSTVDDRVTVEVQEVNPDFGFAEIIAYDDDTAADDGAASPTTATGAATAGADTGSKRDESGAESQSKTENNPDVHTPGPSGED